MTDKQIQSIIRWLEKIHKNQCGDRCILIRKKDVQM